MQMLFLFPYYFLSSDCKLILRKVVTFRRDNPNDAVVMHPKHAHKKLSDLPPGSIIGTSALRRAAQLQRKYPQFKIENIVSIYVMACNYLDCFCSALLLSKQKKDDGL